MARMRGKANMRHALVLRNDCLGQGAFQVGSRTVGGWREVNTIVDL